MAATAACGSAPSGAKRDRSPGSAHVVAVLVDGGEVEHGQQVHVCQASGRQSVEVTPAVRVAQRERPERPPQGLGHQRIAGGEVADVQLVER